eukprot:8900763-Pyramimonas_sp.AAC.1
MTHSVLNNEQALAAQRERTWPWSIPPSWQCDNSQGLRLLPAVQRVIRGGAGGHVRHCQTLLAWDGMGQIRWHDGFTSVQSYVLQLSGYDEVVQSVHVTVARSVAAVA